MAGVGRGAARLLNKSDNISVFNLKCTESAFKEINSFIKNKVRIEVLFTVENFFFRLDESEVSLKAQLISIGLAISYGYIFVNLSLYSNFSCNYFSKEYFMKETKNFGLCFFSYICSLFVSPDYLICS